MDQLCTSNIISCPRKGAKSTTKANLGETLVLLDIKEIIDIKVPLRGKACFSTLSKCDIVDKNLTEAYNAFVVATKGMPILTMFEALWIYSVNWNDNKLRRAEKCYHSITLRIKNQLGNYKGKTRNFKVLFSVRGG
ncbi:hypothetical protein ACFE04_011218 [Oxalis oulophora]